MSFLWHSSSLLDRLNRLQSSDHFCVHVRVDGSSIGYSFSHMSQRASAYCCYMQFQIGDTLFYCLQSRSASAPSWSSQAWSVVAQTDCAKACFFHHFLSLSVAFIGFVTPIRNQRLSNGLWVPCLAVDVYLDCLVNWGVYVAWFDQLVSRTLHTVAFPLPCSSLSNAVVPRSALPQRLKPVRIPRRDGAIVLNCDPAASTPFFCGSP